MQVYNDLDAVVARPSDGLLEVWKLSRDVRLPRPHLESPVPDGYADVVQPAAVRGRGQTRTRIRLRTDTCTSRPRDVPGGGNVDEVLLGDPGVPVVRENGLRGGPGLELPERPFVNDGAVAGVVEETRSYPRL